MPHEGTPVIAVYPRLPPVGPMLAWNLRSPTILRVGHGFGPLSSRTSYSEFLHEWSFCKVLKIKIQSRKYIANCQTYALGEVNANIIGIVIAGGVRMCVGLLAGIEWTHCCYYRYITINRYRYIINGLVCLQQALVTDAGNAVLAISTYWSENLMKEDKQKKQGIKLVIIIHCIAFYSFYSDYVASYWYLHAPTITSLRAPMRSSGQTPRWPSHCDRSEMK